MGKKFDDIVAQQAYRLKLVTIPAAQSGSDFDEHVIQWISNENGQSVHYVVEPDTSWWQRFVAGFWSIIVIESFL